ncbi:conserved hypothetical protein [Neospora caninum Liverpool]|uniref:Uncharacterized protein n=1 Tax=Neospora caninum (strain Liverpool) TaxID=572307 RepID=F0VP57_NEOCL|nr:conserved hypothetical protein [Neospora caninum Liverpool]CBZ55503.1 conserved hypothetical protein [Neospora caninum Liverpool]CEL70241.1 TPA: hypothetical protein BN1204_059280 [Neospora caninum Liverpool]|eukprot:XP_003885531.1 conserved hypothetical protein [Neospora caninum Liverpool]
MASLKKGKFLVDLVSHGGNLLHLQKDAFVASQRRLRYFSSTPAQPTSSGIVHQDATARGTELPPSLGVSNHNPKNEDVHVSSAHLKDAAPRPPPVRKIFRVNRSGSAPKTTATAGGCSTNANEKSDGTARSEVPLKQEKNAAERPSKETGGMLKVPEYGFKYEGPEPTTHGDWSHNGRVTDF